MHRRAISLHPDCPFFILQEDICSNKRKSYNQRHCRCLLLLSVYLSLALRDLRRTRAAIKTPSRVKMIRRHDVKSSWAQRYKICLKKISIHQGIKRSLQKKEGNPPPKIPKQNKEGHWSCEVRETSASHQNSRPLPGWCQFPAGSLLLPWQPRRCLGFLASELLPDPIETAPLQQGKTGGNDISVMILLDSDYTVSYIFILTHSFIINTFWSEMDLIGITGHKHTLNIFQHWTGSGAYPGSTVRQEYYFL